MTLKTLKKRSDFVKIQNTGMHQATRFFVLKALHHQEDAPDIFFGLVASRKLGNAVERNRAKRRLRSALQEVLNAHGKIGWAYVFIARKAVLTGDFQDLKNHLSVSIQKVHKDPA